MADEVRWLARAGLCIGRCLGLGVGGRVAFICAFKRLTRRTRLLHIVVFMRSTEEVQEKWTRQVSLDLLVREWREQR